MVSLKIKAKGTTHTVDASACVVKTVKTKTGGVRYAVQCVTSGGHKLHTFITAEKAKEFVSKGAKEVYVCAAHPIFSGPAVERLANAPIKEVIVTNTIPVDMSKMPAKIKQLSVAPLLGEAISRIHDDESVSSLFGFEKDVKM